MTAATAALARARLAVRLPEWLLLLPTTLVMGMAIIGPIAYTFWVSTRHVDLTEGGEWTSVGFQNYRGLLQDQAVGDALLRTLVFGGMNVALCLAIALVIALTIRERFVGRAILLVLVLVPWAIPPVANGVFWRYIYNAQYGLLNAIAYALGFQDRYQVWLDGETQTLALAAIADSWKFAPFLALIILVALEGIPPSLYRAARIDGATSLRTFWHITLPSIRRTLVLAAIFQALVTLQAFDLIFVLTHGGPGEATTVLNFLVFRKSFELFNLSDGAALGILLAAFTLLLGAAAAAVSVAGRSAARRRPAVEE
jgi:ABC-type sugar transport system permease subunit